MVTRSPTRPVLVLCSEPALRDSLVDLLRSDGRPVTAEYGADAAECAVVIAASHAWPDGWNLARLRSTFARVPCVVLSGSPFVGDFAVAHLARGYFLRLPALSGTILGLVAELSHV